MSELQVLLPEEIKKPKVEGLIIAEPTPEDWIMGASPLKKTILVVDRNWIPFITEYESQKNSLFNQFSCVTQAGWNKVQCLAKRLFNEVLNFSKRYTAKQSGTIPRQGNSVTNVVESIRKIDGGVKEEHYITLTPTMTEAEFYQEIPEDVKAKESFLKEYEYNHEWLSRKNNGFATLPDAEPMTIWDALQYSPVMVSVDGNYEYDENGYVGKFLNYTHEVLIVGGIKDKVFYTLDSENPQGLVPFSWDYRFGYPKVGSLKKKRMPKIYKKKGEPALYALNPEDKNLVPFGDGFLSGGKLFKTLYDVESYSDIPRVKDGKGEDWDELPYLVAPCIFTTTPVNGAAFE